MMFELERRRAAVERHRENAARQAEVYARFDSYGQGLIEFEEVIDFGLTFVEEPYMSYGAMLDLEALSDLQGLAPGVDPVIPITTGLVTEWDQDDRGFYVGAWVGVRVYFPSTDAIPADLELTVSHHFRFAAIAMKDVPVDVRD